MKTWQLIMQTLNELTDTCGASRNEPLAGAGIVGAGCSLRAQVRWSGPFISALTCYAHRRIDRRRCRDRVRVGAADQCSAAAH